MNSTKNLSIEETFASALQNHQKNSRNTDEIYKFLNNNKVNCKNIQYKFNRAVLFNSDYFHETDKIDFKDGYECRRINITYLFGNRLVKSTSK